MKSKQDAVDAGMHQSEDIHCPECGCDFYGNKNLVGDGYRECFNCGQEYWTDIKYLHQCERNELV